MQPTIKTCPATCELCGNWLPQHQTSCPRNGVHPSQWQLSSEIPETALPLSTLAFSTLPLTTPFVPVHYISSPHQAEEHDDLFPSYYC
ncbi:hypothetical protein V8B55DRAFT_1435987 [Mucor lusitanicus]|uniref:Uncharacterized protein n=2 Tax=Mucor circinelloides f. lusitanicus TaxID=29924 RepID=A0A162ZZG3_MUCCL|nr:hypothetical protein FB192DRAFT_1078147 [Mucor lusitanicus]OAD08747.1 hypothetical protein MUCCIDRAFT_105714 [Mucor lusitanicus CBS 277.49]